MPANPRLIQMLGLNDHDRAFEHFYRTHNLPIVPDEPAATTKARQEIFARQAVREKFKGFLPKHADHVQKAMDAGAVAGNTVNGATPLVFDPEIVSILKTEAPLLERLPHEGQRGPKAVTNRIASREAAIGFTSESDALDLTNNTEADIAFAQIEVDMEIWVDLVSISDFAKMISEHYMNLRETTLGERIANHAQVKERAVLYGDPSQAEASGGIGDSDAYEGFAKILIDASRNEDKSSVDLSGTDALLKDIKAEIKEMLQGTNAVAKSDLEIWTSHTLFDELENELEVKRRVNENVNSVNYGFEMIHVSGVPVIASHSVDEHTDGGYTIGSEGDVFIMNRREMRFRSLAPLSMLPLGRRGLSEQIALFEFGAPIMRGNGLLSKRLAGYPI